MNRTLLSGVSALALAASLGAAAPASAAEPVNWTGFYGGLHLGGGDAELDGQFAPSELPEAQWEGDMSGAVGGVHGGYNWQQGNNFVFGVEADASVTNFGQAFGNSDELDGSELGVVDHEDLIVSVRARLGFAADKALVYVTGGAAWQEFTLNKNLFDNPGSSSAGFFKEDSVGGVVGAGGEFRVAPNVSLGGEFLYYFLDDISVAPDYTGSGQGVDVEMDPWVARARLTFHFPG